jgi:hypothetical protein
VGEGKEKNVEAHSHRYPGESDAVKDSGRHLDKLQKKEGICMEEYDQRQSHSKYPNHVDRQVTKEIRKGEE